MKMDFKLPWQKGEDKVKAYSEKERMMRLIIMILAPFYVVWFLFNFLFFMQYPIEWSIMTLVCGFFAWGAGIVILMNQRQMEAGQYQCFRGLTWRMSVTDRIKADVYVDSEIEYIGNLGGYQVYKPHFPYAFFYKHPRLNDGKGLVFNKAFWFLPDKWEQTFFPVPEQEAWYGALPVTVKAEDVTLHNLRWIVNKQGEYIPVALVVDSNRHFEATLGRVQLNEEQKETAIAKYTCEIADLTTKNIDLALELASQTEENQGLLKSTEKQEGLVRERLQDIKRRHSNIARIPTESRWQKINWRAVTVIAVALAIITLVGSVIFHYW
jgi:hypothetical protein